MKKAVLEVDQLTADEKSNWILQNAVTLHPGTGTFSLDVSKILAEYPSTGEEMIMLSIPTKFEGLDGLPVQTQSFGTLGLIYTDYQELNKHTILKNTLATNRQYSLPGWKGLFN